MKAAQLEEMPHEVRLSMAPSLKRAEKQNEQNQRKKNPRPAFSKVLEVCFGKLDETIAEKNNNN